MRGELANGLNDGDDGNNGGMIASGGEAAADDVNGNEGTDAVVDGDNGLSPSPSPVREGNAG